jgi:hypothetical protein
MILPDLFDEIFAVLDAADIGLHVPTDGAGVRGGVPAPYAELPDITYAAGGPGNHRIEDLGLMIVFGPANNAEVFRLALEHASTTGAKSIPALLAAHTWVACGTMFVARAEPSVETVQGANPALAYTFHLQITGG